jgi:CheY-like chemotaxis protein
MLMNNKNKILLLWEDDEDLVKVFSLFLHEHSYSTHSVKSFDECVDVCKTDPPTVLIIRSSVNEPRDGLAFLHRLRLDSSISYFPIIVGLAHFNYDIIEHAQKEAFDAGANACFGYPFDITDVLEEIKVLFNDPTAQGIVDR